MTSQVIVDLPFPVSVNQIWRGGKGRVYRSAAYIKWIKQANLHWLEQRPKDPVARRILGYYTLHIVIHPPDERKRDLWNLEKVCSDFAESVGIVENDSLCRRGVIEYGLSSHAPLGVRLTFRKVHELYPSDCENWEFGYNR